MWGHSLGGGAYSKKGFLLGIEYQGESWRIRGVLREKGENIPRKENSSG